MSVEDQTLRELEAGTRRDRLRTLVLMAAIMAFTAASGAAGYFLVSWWWIAATALLCALAGAAMIFVSHFSFNVGRADLAIDFVRAGMPAIHLHHYIQAAAALAEKESDDGEA